MSPDYSVFQHVFPFTVSEGIPISKGYFLSDGTIKSSHLNKWFLGTRKQTVQQLTMFEKTIKVNVTLISPNTRKQLNAFTM